jgi:hypothetical protein
MDSDPPQETRRSDDIGRLPPPPERNAPKVSDGGITMAQQDPDIDPFKVSSPRIFLVRMLVFLVLGGLLVIILNRQIWAHSSPIPG